MKFHKIVASCLALCLVGSAVPFVNVGEFPAITANAEEEKPTSGKCGENVYWSFDAKTGTLTISGTGEMDDYNGYNGIFPPWDSLPIEQIVIEYGVTNIGSFALCFNDVTSITIPNSVTTIGWSAFRGSKLTNINLPNSVTTLGSSVFAGCSDLKTITLSNSLTSIQGESFWGCDSLTSIVVPSSVTNIEFRAFYGLANLESITICNPNCKIGEFEMLDDNDMTIRAGVIYGYPKSTAQSYARTYSYKFKSIGDLNGDGELTVSDLIEFNQKLHSGESLPKNCDMNGDNIVNVIDLALMKKALLDEKNK